MTESDLDPNDREISLTFYPLPNEVGAEVLVSPRMSIRPASAFSFPKQSSVTRAWISSIFDTHIP